MSPLFDTIRGIFSAAWTGAVNFDPAAERLDAEIQRYLDGGGDYRKALSLVFRRAEEAGHIRRDEFGRFLAELGQGDDGPRHVADKAGQRMPSSPEFGEGRTRRADEAHVEMPDPNGDDGQRHNADKAGHELPSSPDEFGNGQQAGAEANRKLPDPMDGGQRWNADEAKSALPPSTTNESDDGHISRADDASRILPSPLSGADDGLGARADEALSGLPSSAPSAVNVRGAITAARRLARSVYATPMLNGLEIGFHYHSQLRGLANRSTMEGRIYQRIADHAEPAYDMPVAQYFPQEELAKIIAEEKDAARARAA